MVIGRTSSPLSLPPQRQASPPPNLPPEGPSPLPVPASDDQKFQEINMGVLGARQADYAKLMRDLKERRAESQSFLPKLQAEPRKLQDELTVDVLDKEVAGERRIERTQGQTVWCEKNNERLRRLSWLRDTIQKASQEHRKRISDMQ
ncbi:hypothetical protein BYT27DRAFT_7252970 [Phlegmacium glaucopus]|nr:hypothetical protein BYT27DRAFT_7252970 [Phlegmacium glaucopus]